MTAFLKYSLFTFVSALFFLSCSGPKTLLKESVRFDTLNIQLNMRLVQQFEYKEAVQRKMNRFVEVYNTETHPFKLSLNKEEQPAACTIDFVRTKFITKKQSHIAAGVTAAGVATAAVLLSSNFFIPVGWVYVPNAKSTIQPKLSTGISNIYEFPRITIASTGMYRSLEKQVELQSNKMVKYVIQIVLQLEEEYKKNTASTKNQ